MISTLQHHNLNGKTINPFNFDFSRTNYTTEIQQSTGNYLTPVFLVTNNYIYYIENINDVIHIKRKNRTTRTIDDLTTTLDSYNSLNVNKLFRHNENLYLFWNRYLYVINNDFTSINSTTMTTELKIIIYKYDTNNLRYEIYSTSSNRYAIRSLDINDNVVKTYNIDYYTSYKPTVAVFKKYIYVLLTNSASGRTSYTSVLKFDKDLNLLQKNPERDAGINCGGNLYDSKYTVMANDYIISVGTRNITIMNNKGFCGYAMLNTVIPFESTVTSDSNYSIYRPQLVGTILYYYVHNGYTNTAEIRSINISK